VKLPNTAHRTRSKVRAKKPITLVPDYLFTVNGNFTFVFDAKAAREAIKTGHNVVYSYLVHPEIVFSVDLKLPTLLSRPTITHLHIYLMVSCFSGFNANSEKLDLISVPGPLAYVADFPDSVPPSPRMLAAIAPVRPRNKRPSTSTDMHIYVVMNLLKS
jgi:hypothetical protein